ncbi:hypothetical protein M413DRAFT_27272 [Hebeloma cylindrosporum]|uniref:Protein kinase domain-containing protein n=1 Tax=Hebeloma cylindrosporum TaxID=76867 RepID=A0A0C2XVL4_HEBCY|nr:hypothetical protein M413DRAFT_27272 [Hebeloma cylindrosporum h7]
MSHGQFPPEPLSDAGFGYFPMSPSQTLKMIITKSSESWAGGPGRPYGRPHIQSNGIVTKYCVIKILTVPATDEHRALRGLPPDVKALHALRDSQPGYHRLPTLLDHFSESSIHGNHLCVVNWDILLDIDTTLRLTAPDKYLRVHLVRQIIASVTEPLMALHQTGFFHGAVKPDNFSFYIFSQPECLEPRLSELPPMDSRPPSRPRYHIIISQPILHDNSWEDDHIAASQYMVYLNNFGHAWRPSKNAKWYTGNPSSLGPPEVILGLKAFLNQRVDVWMLGCPTFLLLTGEQLFTPEPQDDADHLARIMKLAGETFDPAICKESTRHDEFFLASGQPKFELSDGNLILEERLCSLSCLSADDVKPAAEFIARCLKVEPAKRAPVRALQEHDWLDVGYICICGYCV